MKTDRPLVVYTTDPTSSQALAWAQQLPGGAIVRPLSQLSQVVFTPAPPAATS